MSSHQDLSPNGTVWLFYLTRYGETWSTSRIKYKISSAYPTCVQTSDGKLHVIYTSHRRRQINHVVFDESAILSCPAD